MCASYTNRFMVSNRRPGPSLRDFLAILLEWDFKMHMQILHCLFGIQTVPLLSFFCMLMTWLLLATTTATSLF